MRRELACIAVAIVSLPLMAQAPVDYENVLVPGGSGETSIAAFLKRPNGTNGPWPVVVGLHGCGGLITRTGTIQKRETDWAERWSAAGYAVLFPDSFNPRGFREICTLTSEKRSIRPADRARDAAATIAWASRQPWADSKRIALIGWSHGASSVLWAVRSSKSEPLPVRTAVAFYPGCRPMAESKAWAPGNPLTILIGDADDWTLPEHCRALAMQHASITLIEYPGAVHGFDAPDTPLRTRTDVGLTANGRAKVGTDLKARAAAIGEVTRILAEAFK